MKPESISRPSGRNVIANPGQKDAANESAQQTEHADIANEKAEYMLQPCDEDLDKLNAVAPFSICCLRRLSAKITSLRIV